MKLIAPIKKASTAEKILAAMGWNAGEIRAASRARMPAAGPDPPDGGESWEDPN